MKNVFFYIIFFLSSIITTHAADLTLVSPYLFELALNHEQFTPKDTLSITAQTLTMSNEALTPHARTIIARIAQECPETSPATPEHVAITLAQLILDQPTQLQILYTLTQLVQVSITQSPDESLENNADAVVSAVHLALQPFIQQQRKKRFIFWCLIGGGIALGAALGTIAYKLYTQHQLATQTLAQVQARLAAQAKQLATQAQQLENVTDRPSIQPEIDALQATMADQAAQQEENTRSHRKLKRDTALQQEQLHTELENLRTERKQALTDTQQLIAQVQSTNVQAITVIKRKLQEQQQDLNQGLKAVQEIIAIELGEEADTNDEIPTTLRSLKELTDWVSLAKSGVDLVRGARNAGDALVALQKRRV